MYKMAYYDTVDVPEDIDVNKSVHLKNALFVIIGIF